MKLKSIYIALLACAGLTSCYYDVQEELHPTLFSVNCATTDYTFSGRVSDILQVNCVGCHSQTLASGGVVLDTYNSVKAYADNGKLLGTIEHSTGFAPMPYNLPQLSSCDRLTIKNWIENGSTNN